MTEKSEKPRVGGPAHGTRPPFEKGNLLARKHGAFSRRTVDPVAEEVIAEAVEVAPYLDRPEFRPALEAWARSEAACRLVDEWIQANGLFDEDGKETMSIGSLISLERLAKDQRAALGLDPASRTRIEKDLAIVRGSRGDLEALAARGRAALEARNGDTE